MNSQQALDIVFDAIDVVNRQRADDNQISKRSDVILIGDGGALDSLGFVTLILAIERRVADVVGVEIELLDGEGYGVESFDSRTASSFCDLILARISAP